MASGPPTAHSPPVTRPPVTPPPVTPPPPPPSTTASTPSTIARFTRSALKKIPKHSSTGSPVGSNQALLQQYAEFQHGLPAPTPKRRRVGSSTNESTTEHDEEQHHHGRLSSAHHGAARAEQENEAPSLHANVPAMAVIDTPAKAALPASSADEPKVVGSLHGGKTASTTPVAASNAVATTATVAEIALAQDEKKLDGAPEGELYVVTVLSSSELTAADNVDAEVAAVDELLAAKAAASETKDESDLSWAKEYAALDSLRRLAIYHPERLETFMLANGDRVVNELVCPAAMSLRSAMVRNALLSIQDVVAALKHDGERFFGSIVPVLLQRSAHEKQFIRDLARDALTTCVETSPRDALLAELLRASLTEKNAQIVSTAGQFAQKCVGRMEKSRLETFVLTTHESFMEEMSAFLNCKVVECKAAARKTLQCVRRYVGEPAFTTLAKAKLDGTAQFEVLKASEDKKPSTAKSGVRSLSVRERMLQMKKQQAASGAAAAPAGDEVVVLVPDATR